MKIKLQADETRLKSLRELLSSVPKGIEKATMRAVNRALSSGKTQISRDVRKAFTVRSDAISETVKERKATLTNLSGELSSKGRSLPLRAFKHTPTDASTTGGNRKPVRVTVKKGQSFDLQRGFKWKGHIFERNENAPRTRVYQDRRNGRKRLGAPIEKKFDRAVPQMIEEVAVQSVQAKMQDVMQKRLDHEARQLLKGASK